VQLFGSKRPCTGAAAGLTEIKCFPSPSAAGATTSKRRNCLFRLKKPIRPVPALPAYAYQEASSLVLAEEVRSFWFRSKPNALKQRWRDATLMDLAAPELRPLIDIRFRPHLRSQNSFAPETISALRERNEAHAATEARAPLSTGEVRSFPLTHVSR
jgi:hypothetical protein